MLKLIRTINERRDATVQNILKKESLIKRYAVIMLGNLLVAFAVGCIYIPNKIVSGGVSGISNIVYHTFGIQPGISMLVVNAIFAVVSLKKLGVRFLANSFISAIAIAVFSDLFVAYVPPVTANPLLATIFGGVIYGFGIGLSFVEGASTGGTDILSRFLQAINPHIKIGRVLLAVDATVIITSLITFRQIDLALYGIIALSISTYAIDWLIGKLNVSKLAYVVTDKGEEISKLLTSTSPRGVTIIDVTGAYTMEKKTLLMCALKSNEIVEFQRKILEVDESSFIIFSESQQIVGNGFRVYN